MNFIQKIEIFENETHRADKEFDSPLKIALLVFGLPGLVMLLIMRTLHSKAISLIPEMSLVLSLLHFLT